MPPTRRQATRLLLGGGLASLLAACQAPPGTASTAPAAAPTASNPLVKPRAAAGAELTAVQASSELAQGRNRFAIGLINAQNQPVTGGDVRLEFFKLKTASTAEKRADAIAAFRSVGGPSKGVWVGQATFSETGAWGARITLAPQSEAPKSAQLNFEVLPKFSAPGYDEPAVRSPSPTAADVNGDLTHICSNSPPCALHTQSIDAALAPAQKPLVVLFATPALCTSATCAPQLEAIQQLRSSYAERANFIHVEIYQYPFDQLKTAKAVDEWHLPSDPWTFIVDRTGTVRDRFEGAAPMDELEPSLRAVLG